MCHRKVVTWSHLAKCTRSLTDKPLLKSVLVNRDFLIRFLIGFRLYCQSIRSQVEKILLTNMDVIHVLGKIFQTGIIAGELYQLYLILNMRGRNWRHVIQPSTSLILTVHWKQNIVNLTTPSSLVAPQVVVTTTCAATSDDRAVKLTTFCFQCTAKCNTTVRFKICFVSWRYIVQLRKTPPASLYILTVSVTRSTYFAY